MATIDVPLSKRGFGHTSRPDAWWIQPLTVFLCFSAFIVYATFATFQGDHYTAGPYLSPFYSPEIFGASEHSWFGPKARLVAHVVAVLARTIDSLGSFGVFA